MNPSADDPDSASKRSFLLNKSIFFVLLLFLACSKHLKDAKQSTTTIGKNLFSEKETQLIKPDDKKKKKKIYLTFDDGPNKGTRNVLDIVKDEEIPVSFFIVGEHVYASREQNITWDSITTAKQIEICNHSFTHAWHNKYEKFYQSPDSVIKDFERARDSLKLKNNIVRTPGRNTWRIDSIQFTDIKKSKAAVDSLEKAGFIVMGWDLEWHYDSKTLQVKNTGEEILNQIDSVFAKGKTKLPDNLVLLAHDQVYKSSNDSLQLREFIQKLKQKGEYELSIVSNYPGLNNAKDTTQVKSTAKY